MRNGMKITKETKYNLLTFMNGRLYQKLGEAKISKYLPHFYS